MSHVVVLIADPARADLHDSIAQAVRAALGARAVTWLAPGIAAEIDAPGGDASAVHAVIGGASIDVAVVPAANRRKKLLVADMESTLVENEFLDELAAHAGIGARIADITRRTMAGELDFAGSLRERVAMLKGANAALLEETYKGLRIMPGAKALIATMRAHGATTAIVSGGFRIFADRVRASLGAETADANDLEVDNGLVTGRLREPILDRNGKHEILKRLANARGLSLDDAITVGDGANDLDMIRAAGLGVAFHGKPVLAEAAHVSIRHGDLTALLYLQGYRVSDFAA